MKAIPQFARCRNCGRPATDRKRQVCSRLCRVVLRMRRLEWEQLASLAAAPDTRPVAIEVQTRAGSRHWLREHEFQDPQLDPFIAWQINCALASWRADLLVTPRPGKR